MRSLLAIAAACALAGCAHARLVGEETLVPPDPAVERIVVVEPFFEQTDWEFRTVTEQVPVSPSALNPMGSFGPPQDVLVSREVAEKHLYARVPSLAAEHQQVLAEVQRLRPSWRVVSTGALPALTGPVSLVRTIVGHLEVVESNRTLKNLACGFGILIWPLLLYDINPVHETQRVNGAVIRFETDAESARGRMLKYPTQPDYAIDTRGFEPLNRQFGLDVEFEEGVLAPEGNRGAVLVGGFAKKLAAAVVAIVEEGR